jgi:hypothetical protein
MGSIFFFAIERKKEARSKRQEARDLSADRQARTKSQEEIELFAVRFLCACLPQAGLCVFARKKKKEPRDLSADRQARTKRIKSRFSHLASKFKTPTSQK